jgi:hypothetical protein
MAVSTACSEGPSQREQAASQTAASSGDARTIVSSGIRVDSSTGTAVISSAQKFILPVPALAGGGEPLRYPAGHEKAGTLILDFQGKPVGERGLVFFNDKDQSVQAVSGDGQGVVIINEVTAEQADQIDRRIQQLGAGPNALTLEQLKQVLDYARTELKLGDMYNSTRDFVRDRMTPVLASGDAADAHPAYGLKKRDDRDICYAVYVPGRFAFEGPAATPQVFESGGVIVAQGGELRGVQPDVFVRTYRLADGRSISSVTADLRVHEAAR